MDMEGEKMYEHSGLPYYNRYIAFYPFCAEYNMAQEEMHV